MDEDHEEKLLCLKIRTEGISLEENIIQLSISDVQNNILFDQKFNSSENQINRYTDEINIILSRADKIIGYNIYYDLQLLENNKILQRKRKEIHKPLSEDLRYQWIYQLKNQKEFRYDKDIIDVMEMSTTILDNKSLESCATYYGYQNKINNNLDELKAIIFCYLEIMDYQKTILKLYQDGFEETFVKTISRSKYYKILTHYAYLGFDLPQLYAIGQGIRLKLDVSMYADKRYSGKQMEQLRLGMMRGADIRLYADPKYSVNELILLSFAYQNKQNPGPADKVLFNIIQKQKEKELEI